jgi:hypothetical protein
MCYVDYHDGQLQLIPLGSLGYCEEHTSEHSTLTMVG